MNTGWQRPGTTDRISFYSPCSIMSLSVNSRLPQLQPSCGPLSLSCCSATQSCTPPSSILHLSPSLSLFALSVSYLSSFTRLCPSCSPHQPPFSSLSPAPLLTRGPLADFMIVMRQVCFKKKGYIGKKKGGG